jgi:hypothetical protein
MEKIPTFLNSTNSSPTTGLLEQINELVAKLVELEEQIEADEKSLQELKNAHKLISESHLPDLFDQAGLTEIKASNGKIIKLTEFYVGDTKNPEALRWLEENHLDTIIKNTFTINFGRGEESEARKLESELETLGLPFQRKEAIHPSTLKSFINEQVEQNPDFPQLIFNVQKISRVKASK